MSDVHIDNAAFRKRIHSLQRKLASGDGFNGAQSIMVIIGKSDPENPYIRSSTLHVSI
jgi:nucleosome binding factor SPN SPT16 subunit